MNKVAGYITDVPYVFSFYKEMQPVWLNTVAVFQGMTPPDINATFTYCELGCGLGINLLIAAICNPQGCFVGVDVNAEHIRCANTMAEQLALTNLSFIQADFAEFAGTNQQEFDFIVCHGTWSWISAENKQHILHIVGQKLRPLGLFYLHYMCHPGATQMLPIQKLIRTQTNLLSGSSIEKMQAAVYLLKQLLAAGMFHDNPTLEQHLDTLSKREPNYLAHDLLSEHWLPEHSCDVHNQIKSEEVSYIGSANVLDNITALSVPGAIQPVLETIVEVQLREQIKEMSRNQHQRTDLFQRFAISLTREQQALRLSNMSFVYLNNTDTAAGICFDTPIGPINASTELIAPIMQLASQQPATYSELSKLKIFTQQPALLLQILQMLMWHESIHPTPEVHKISHQQQQNLSQWFEKNSLPLKVNALCGAVLRT